MKTLLAAGRGTLRAASERRRAGGSSRRSVKARGVRHTRSRLQFISAQGGGGGGFAFFFALPSAVLVWPGVTLHALVPCNRC